MEKLKECFYNILKLLEKRYCLVCGVKYDDLKNLNFKCPHPKCPLNMK